MLAESEEQRIQVSTVSAFVLFGSNEHARWPRYPGPLWTAPATRSGDGALALPADKLWKDFLTYHQI
jgi:hypothetical protein